MKLLFPLSALLCLSVMSCHTPSEQEKEKAAMVAALDSLTTVRTSVLSDILNKSDTVK